MRFNSVVEKSLQVPWLSIFTGERVGEQMHLIWCELPDPALNPTPGTCTGARTHLYSPVLQQVDPHSKQKTPTWQQSAQPWCICKQRWKEQLCSEGSFKKPYVGNKVCWWSLEPSNIKKWGALFTSRGGRWNLACSRKFFIVVLVSYWITRDGIQDPLPQSMAPWHSKDFQLK